MGRKLLLGLLLGTLLITTVMAIWIVSIMSSSSITIYSEEYGGFSIIKHFNNFTLDSLNNSIQITDPFTFYYDGVETTMEAYVNTTHYDVADTCDDWINDCEYKYDFDNQIESLVEGINIIPVKYGENSIYFNATCVQYSCPQVLVPSVKITKLPTS